MTTTLFHELAISTGLVAATVVIHLVGIDVLMSLLILHMRRFTTWVHVDRMIVPLLVVLGLFTIHGVEIWLYAFAYRLLGALPDLEQALYFSIGTYSTLGEAGALLPAGWRVLGALEAINGMLLIGWSTAFLFQVLNHLLAPEGDDHPLPKGAIARPRGGTVRRSRPPP